ncbi:uncharacterized protein LOC110853159 isoform X2 [Folsomia candida]|nr:uncharacterized protein LOC110853159 isoform X2 [Folsomia candida]XP_035710604.1 uncharacterized protein LOC110853159 isoform X2 [Folsomia candida]XP_035710605.1 uncharacterized protein LOC110853159 isoform X2 [Folsomia candida]XP_035710606.1 uncharacterized protein LOC110853159 isoform X2 [Folsomia candida]XP_035710607.1 uncharacterized protein LOC110853159 isoform X2 [Folsomia candida]
MQRQRKKDLNLKPNRVLDKRSSRGMIYENEELRLRTLAIADDVDRGHTDIKKLRRENDHLKRELWALRDECEKLEEILKRVISSGNVDPSLLPYPELFLDSEDPSLYDGSSRKGSIEEGEGLAAGFVNSIFCTSGDNEDTGSVIHNVQGEDVSLVESQIIVDPQQPSTSSSCTPPPIPKYVIGPDLEPLKEENEDPSRSQSLATLANLDGSTHSPPPPRIVQFDNFNLDEDSDELPDPEELLLHQEENEDGIHTPLIQITGPATPSTSSKGTTPTPMSTPRPNSTQQQYQQHDTDNNIADIQDGGCVTSIPAKYEVTSQFHVTGGRDTACSSPLFASPRTPTPPGGARASKKFRNSSGALILRNGEHYHVHSPQHATATTCPSCYHSEPSLVGSLVGESYPVDWNLAMMRQQRDRSRISTLLGLETILAVGVVSGAGVTSPLEGQDVIDELEAQWDPSLERVKGIRVLGGVVIFLRVRDAEALSGLVDAFGEDKDGLRVKGGRVKFHHGSDGPTELRLIGLGPEVPDESVVSFLNAFGQVISPIERRSYKGVEIWERTIRLHLVTPHPSTLCISGYSVTLTVVQEGRNYCLLDTSQTPVNPNVSLANPSAGIELLKSDTGTDSKNPSNKSDEPAAVATSSSSSLLLTAHKPVARSSSSNPRLELGPSPSSPVPQKRSISASVCTANLPPEQHPGRLFSKNPNLHKTSAVITPPPPATVPPTPTVSSTIPNSAPNLTTPGSVPPGGKKPLSRVLKSSPGNLVPPTPTTPTVEQAVTPGTPSSPRTGLRAAFCRGLSIDPTARRRDSAISNHAPADNNNKSSDWRRGSSAFYSRFGGGGHQPLSQMNSSSSSHNSYQSRSGRNGGGGAAGLAGKGEPLPWCGCWGNGCI